MLFSTDFVNRIERNGLDDTRRTKRVCDFLIRKFVMEKRY